MAASVYGFSISIFQLLYIFLFSSDRRKAHRQSAEPSGSTPSHDLTVTAVTEADVAKSDEGLDYWACHQLDMGARGATGQAISRALRSQPVVKDVCKWLTDDLKTRFRMSWSIHRSFDSQECDEPEGAGKLEVGIAIEDGLRRSGASRSNQFDKPAITLRCVASSPTSSSDSTNGLWRRTSSSSRSSRALRRQRSGRRLLSSATRHRLSRPRLSS